MRDRIMEAIDKAIENGWFRTPEKKSRQPRAPRAKAPIPCRGHEPRALGAPPPLEINECSSAVCLANYVLNRCRVEHEAGCWSWSLATSDFGHGRIKLEGKLLLPHRVVAVGVGLVSSYAVLGKNDYVLHRCDNPRCCNPKHLFAGSKADNMQDCAAKGRLHKQKVR